MSEISQIENVITTTFRARGGNVTAQLGSYAQGFGRLGQQISQNASMSDRLNRQWQALGTTIRYSIAGAAVFGLTRMVGQLKDVNTQLGLMAAIASGPSGAPFSSSQITTLGQQLQKTAVDAITPINQINDATVNFFSTVQNVPRSQVPDILREIAQAAMLAQTPVEDLTQAATTMNIAFGRANSAKSIGQFTRMWWQLIQTAPGGITAAPQIAQGLPGLASMFQLAPGRQGGGRGQQQMMALTLGVLRTGMPPSTALRGLTYLAQSIAQPTGKARGALASVGITPQFVQQRGIYESIMKLLHTIRPVSARRAKQLGAIPDETLDAIGDTGNLPGIPAAEMGRLRQMIPRIHGIRAAIILSSQLQQHGTVGSIQQDLNDMNAQFNDHAKDVNSMAKAWDRFQKRSRLQQASVAINAMSLQVAQTFEPILNYAARGGIGLERLMQRHPLGTKIAVGGGAAFLAAMGVARFIPGASRVPGIGRFLGMGGQGYVKAISTEAALSGNTMLGGSPQNPMYVIVVGQIFGGSTPAPTKPGGAISTIENDAKKIAGGAGIGGFFGRVLAGRGLAVGGSLALVGGALATRKLMEQYVSGPLGNRLGLNTLPVAWSPTGQPYRRGAFANYSMGVSAQHYQELHRAQQLFGRHQRVIGISQYGAGTDLKGRADIYMTIEQKDASGKISTRKVHVPVELWRGGRSPQTRGKHTTVRGK